MITITRVRYNIYLQLLQPHNNNNKIYFRNAAIYTKIHLRLIPIGSLYERNNNDNNI